MGSLTPPQVLQALEILMQNSAVGVGVVPIDVSLGSAHFMKSSFFEELVKEAQLEEDVESTTSSQGPVFLSELQQAPIGDRQDLLVGYLQEQIANAVRMDPSQLDVQQPLNTLGLDSLMAVELRNQLMNALQVEIPIERFLEGLTTVQLASTVLGMLAMEDAFFSRNESADFNEDIEEFNL